MEKRKYAIALGSGAQKGFVHIGVLKALEDLDIEITHIGGTSVGSLIGAMYSLYKDVKRIEEFALKIDGKQISDLLSSYIDNRPTKKRDPLLFFIENYVHQADFQDCVIPFVSVSVDLNSGEKVFHKKGPLKHAIRASCSVPYIFGAYNYKDKFHIDGGYADSVPVDAVKDIGGDKTIGVNLQGYIPSSPEKRSFLDIQSSTYKTTLYNIAKEDMKLADKKLSFNLEEYRLNDVLEDRHSFINMGYEETMKLFKD
jgi:NTE family protein